MITAETSDLSSSDSHHAHEDAAARVTRLSFRYGFDAVTITGALLAELDVTGTADQVLRPLVVS